MIVNSNNELKFIGQDLCVVDSTSDELDKWIAVGDLCVDVGMLS